MAKLPKELQKKKKQKLSQIKKKPYAAGQSGVSRAMRRKLQQQGIEGMEEINAEEVIIKCSDKVLIIKNPNVIQLKQQGMTIHQVIGEPIEKDLSELSTEISTETEEEIEKGTELEQIGSKEDIKEELQKILEEDVIIVATQAGVSNEVAREALKEADGDLARAILNLKTRK
ncbi:MAG: nascent polypeptide-associated complex protein [Promethearchaeota archaeon]